MSATKSSDTGGVQPMNIGGRTTNERERLIGMTDEERAWRARYLKSQILAPEEPITPENYYRERYNPIRRFYRAPMDKLQSALTPIVGKVGAGAIRSSMAKLAIGLAGVYATWYYLKYNKMSWIKRSGWKVSKSRETVYPGHKDFPNYRKHGKGSEYNVLDFDKSPI